MLYLILLTSIAGTNASLPINQGELQALFDFKATLAPFFPNTRSIVDTWVEEVDPCNSDNELVWVGVMCNCLDTLSSIKLNDCPSGDNDTSHVYGLDLAWRSSYVARGWSRLHGTLSPAMQGLTELHFFSVANNRLYGPLPDNAIRQLLQLQSFDITGNLQLNGSLPSFPATLPNLLQVLMARNDFVGPIPDPWCERFSNANYPVSLSVIILDNPKLCGIRTSCLSEMAIMQQEWSAFQYSFVAPTMSVFNNNFEDELCCRALPPICSQPCDGLLTPDFWTSKTAAQFTFSPYQLQVTDPTGSPSNVLPLPIFYEFRIRSNATVVSQQSNTCSQFLGNYPELYPNGTVDRSDNTESQSARSFSIVNATGSAGQPIREATFSISVPSEGPILQGGAYVMDMTIYNARCPSRFTTTQSTPTLVVTEGPRPRPISNTLELGDSIDTSTTTSGIGISFAPWSDVQYVPCCTYTAQIYQGEPPSIIEDDTMWADQVVAGPLVSVTELNPNGYFSQSIPAFEDAPMQPGRTYFVLVNGTNAAKLTSYAASGSIDIVSPAEAELPRDVVLGISGGIGLPLLLACIGGGFYLLRRIHRQAEEAQRDARRRQELLDAMTAIAQQQEIYKGVTTKLQPVMLSQSNLEAVKEGTIVVTDLENSTGCAKADPDVYREVQRSHDQILRELIATHGGVEIATQGDSFTVLFGSVAAAVKWSCSVQLRLLNTPWPESVYKLPSCQKVLGPDGKLVFKGPRVRIGIHWADPGTFKCKSNPIGIYGRAWTLTDKLADSGNGGQVVLSQRAWERLSALEGCPAAGFPIVQQLGLFELLPNSPAEWIYEVRGLLSNPLLRRFCPTNQPRKLTCLFPGRELHVTHAPASENSQGVVFVAARLELPNDSAVSRRSVGSWMRRFITVLCCCHVWLNLLEALKKVINRGKPCSDGRKRRGKKRHAAKARWRSWRGRARFTMMAERASYCNGSGVVVSLKEPTCHPPSSNDTDNTQLDSLGDAGPHSPFRLVNPDVVHPPHPVPGHVEAPGAPNRFHSAPGSGRHGLGSHHDGGVSEQHAAVSHDGSTGKDSSAISTAKSWRQAMFGLAPTANRKLKSRRHASSTFVSSRTSMSLSDVSDTGAVSPDSTTSDSSSDTRAPHTWGLRRWYSLKSTARRKCGAGDDSDSHADDHDLQPERLAEDLWVIERAAETLLVAAQQFKGYAVHSGFQGPGNCHTMLFAFHDSLDALHFCHLLQIGLLYTPWTRLVPTMDTQLFGPEEMTADGRLLFCGPRIAMAIHASREFRVASKSAVQWNGETIWPSDAMYTGHAVEEAMAIAQVLHGGQVAMTQDVWTHLHGKLGMHQTISLGVHAVPNFYREDHQPASDFALLQILPLVLGLRRFPPLPVPNVLPGYYDSPDPNTNVAICFLKACTPSEVEPAMHASPSDVDARQIRCAYYEAVLLVETLIRRLLLVHRDEQGRPGYECKSPESGKFTLAFSSLQIALEFCANLQQQLLRLPWPSLTLTWDSCAVRYGSTREDSVRDGLATAHRTGDAPDQERVQAGDRQLLWNGLRVKAGVSWGVPAQRKPLNTGAADYFGATANVAARLMGKAAPGQTLIPLCPDLLANCHIIPLPAADPAVKQLIGQAGIHEASTSSASSLQTESSSNWRSSSITMFQRLRKPLGSRDNVRDSLSRFISGSQQQGSHVRGSLGSFDHLYRDSNGPSQGRGGNATGVCSPSEGSATGAPLGFMPEGSEPLSGRQELHGPPSVGPQDIDSQGASQAAMGASNTSMHRTTPSHGDGPAESVQLAFWNAGEDPAVTEPRPCAFGAIWLHNLGKKHLKGDGWYTVYSVLPVELLERAADFSARPRSPKPAVEPEPIAAAASHRNEWLKLAGNRLLFRPLRALRQHYNSSDPPDGNADASNSQGSGSHTQYSQKSRLSASQHSAALVGSAYKSNGQHWRAASGTSARLSSWSEKAHTWVHPAAKQSSVSNSQAIAEQITLTDAQRKEAQRMAATQVEEMKPMDGLDASAALKETVSAQM